MAKPTLLEVAANYPCGPTPTITRELEELGVELVECGGTQISGVRVLGKGTVGIVVCGLLSGLRVAVKIRRCDSPRPNMHHEAHMLELANSVGVGPRLIAHTDNVLVMELVEGTPLKHHEKLGDKELEACVEDALKQAFKLDEIGLDHGELSNPHSHVYATPGGAKIIDFDGASTARKPHNYNSLYAYFFIAPTPLAQRVRAIFAGKQPPRPTETPKPNQNPTGGTTNTLGWKTQQT